MRLLRTYLKGWELGLEQSLQKSERDCKIGGNTKTKFRKDGVVCALCANMRKFLKPVTVLMHLAAVFLVDPMYAFAARLKLTKRTAHQTLHQL